MEAPESGSAENFFREMQPFGHTDYQDMQGSSCARTDKLVMVIKIWGLAMN